MSARVGQVAGGFGFGFDIGNNFILDEVFGFQTASIEKMNDGNPVLLFTTALDFRGFEIPVSRIAGGSRAPYNFEKIASGHIGANTSELWIGRGGRGTAHDFRVDWAGWGERTWLSAIAVEIGGATTGTVEGTPTVVTGFHDVTSGIVTPTQNGDTVAIFFGWDGGIFFWPLAPWDFWAPDRYPYNFFPDRFFDFTFQEVFHQIGVAGTDYSAELRAPGLPWLLGGSGGIVAIAAVVKAEVWNPVVSVI